MNFVPQISKQLILMLEIVFIIYIHKLIDELKYVHTRIY